MQIPFYIIAQRTHKIAKRTGIISDLGLVFIWSCFVFCLLLLLYYVICAPVLIEGTGFMVR